MPRRGYAIGGERAGIPAGVAMNNLIVAAPAGNEPDKQPITFGAAGKVLACGFDTIWVSLGLVWHNENFFNLLTRLKNDAHAQGVAMPGVMEANGLRWVFNLEPRGAIGFEWLLKSRDFDVKMIRSRTMIQRPSAVVEIRSATLWQKGVIATIQRRHFVTGHAGASGQGNKAPQASAVLTIRRIGDDARGVNRRVGWWSTLG